MKQIIYILILFSVLLVLPSCNTNSGSRAAPSPSVTMPEHSEEEEGKTGPGRASTSEANQEKHLDDYLKAVNAYREFLLGNRLSFYDSDIRGEGSPSSIYINPTKDESKFTLLDMNDDGVPELHLQWLEYTILTFKEGEVVLWANCGHYAILLNNRAVWSERRGGAPIRSIYNYSEFNSTGNTKFAINFQELLDEDGQFDLFGDDERYSIGSDFVSREQFQQELGHYQAIGSDMIPWINYMEWYQAHRQSE